jgi:RHS repeat-associated protein/uncharacterized protein (TIGR03000 family)
LVTGSSGTTDRYLAFGYQFDAESGLYYVMARYMDPVTHSFLQQDPIYADVNGYRYAGNNPTNMVDPSGLAAHPAMPRGPIIKPSEAGAGEVEPATLVVLVAPNATVELDGVPIKGTGPRREIKTPPIPKFAKNNYTYTVKATWTDSLNEKHVREMTKVYVEAGDTTVVDLTPKGDWVKHTYVSPHTYAPGAPYSFYSIDPLRPGSLTSGPWVRPCPVPRWVAVDRSKGSMAGSPHGEKSIEELRAYLKLRIQSVEGYSSAEWGKFLSGVGEGITIAGGDTISRVFNFVITYGTVERQREINQWREDLSNRVWKIGEAIIKWDWKQAEDWGPDFRGQYQEAERDALEAAISCLDNGPTQAGIMLGMIYYYRVQNLITGEALQLLRVGDKAGFIKQVGKDLEAKGGHSVAEQKRILDNLRKASRGKYRGGRHGMTSKPVGDNLHSHHMPASSVNGLQLDKGPAIQMEIADHNQTASHGSQLLKGAKYRARQAALIAKGRFGEAIQMDIDDITKKFPGKYNEAIHEMLESLDPSMRIGLRNPPL